MPLATAPALRLERLELRHVKKLESLVLEPNSAGVTVIHGENESGKSTIIEAFEMLISDTALKSTKAEAKALRPMGTDEKPYVEATMRIGDYRLTYGRSFAGASSKATLKIHEPRVQNFTGTEAFNKFREILEEHSDENLRSAMSIEQGDILNLAKLFNKTDLSSSISRAGADRLDRTDEVSAVVVDEATQWIMEAAKDERGKYYTPRSRDTWVKSFKAQYEQFLQAEENLDAARQRLNIAESHAVKIEKAHTDLGRIAQEREQTGQRLEELEEQQQKVRVQVDELEQAQRRAQDTDTQYKALNEEIQRRDELSKEIDQLKLSLATAQKVADAAKEQSAAGEEKLRLQRAQGQADRTELNLATAVRELVRARQDRAAAKKQYTVLQENSDVAGNLEMQRAELQQQLDSNLCTPDAVRRIEEAEQEWRLSIARRDLVATSIGITGPDNSVIQDGDNEVRLDERSYHTKIAERRTFTLGDFTVEVNPPADAEGSDQEVSGKRERVSVLLTASLPGEDRGNSTGLADEDVQNLVEKARERAARYTKVQADLAEVKSKLRAILSNQSIDEVNEEVNRLQQAIEKADQTVAVAESTVEQEFNTWREAYAFAHGGQNVPHALEELTIMGSFDENWILDIRGRLDSTERSSHRWLDDAHEALKKAEKQLAMIRTTLELRQQDWELGEQRQPQADLRDKCAEAKDVAEQSQEQVHVLKRELAKLTDPELLHSKVQGKREQLRTLDARQRGAEEEILIAQHELEQADGTAEDVQEAEAEYQQLKSAFAAAERRANAANLLNDLFAEAHEEVKDRYQAPFLNEFTRLAKNIFGNDVSFELDGDLAITARITDGLDIPLGQLSGGATEQIAMLYRLAAASLMGEGEAVPIFLDDTLGYTDADRAENMNAVLAMMGQEHQIIVTTCDVSRFSAIHEAQVVKIEELQG